MIEICSYCGRQLVPMDNERPETSLKICPVCIVAALKERLGVRTMYHTDLMESIPAPGWKESEDGCPAAGTCGRVEVLEADLDNSETREKDMEDDRDDLEKELNELKEALEPGAFRALKEEKDKCLERLADMDRSRADLQAEMNRLANDHDMLKRLVMWKTKARSPSFPGAPPPYQTQSSYKDLPDDGDIPF